MPDIVHRPNPEDLLAVVQAEEQRAHRGRLKIFLGYCAGVGKTYAMLEAARQKREEGVQVLVGWVDTHGRIETQAMLEGLEVLPRRARSYREVELEELDLDQILELKPQLVLVDELAHTNVPGSRHRKRWQDVEELLKAGIDVYTTLNIQHLESLNDVVAQITRVKVRETLPDRVLDEADEIKLIDLPPEELLQRLKEGKVYIPTQARYAAENFFGPGKLAALRELVMRRAAERVDFQMRAHMQLMAIAGPWPASERLLVCVGPSPFSERLIRATRRLATQLKASWEALYVESPESSLTDVDREQLESNLILAESLGARTVRLSGSSLVATTLEYARGQNVTKVVMGRSDRTPWWTRSISDRLIEESGDIDVVVISRGPGAAALVRPRSPAVTAWRSYALALTLVALVTGLGELVDPFLEITNLVMFYLLGVVLTALVAGRGPAALSAGLSVLAFDFFFVPPRYTFAVSDTEYFVTFAALLVVGLLVGDLTARERDQVQASRRSQLQVMAAYALSRDLALAANEHEIVAALMASLQGPLGVPATLYLSQGERLVVHPASLHQLSTPEDVAVATWVYRNGQPAGCGTDTLPAVSDFYFPLRQGDQTVAVLRLKLDGNKLTASQRQLVETLTNLEAMALHRVRLTEEARRAQLLEETERLHTILFNSVSHDLQTPITSIMGSLDSLLDPALQSDDAARASLLSSAREQTDRLRGLVVNLLDMSRVESRQTRLNREPCELSDLIGSALGRLEQAYAARPVEVEIPVDFPMIPVDFVPFSQVLYNLLENAVKYSPEGSAVHIEARVVDKIARRAQIRISDRGAGIPAESRERIFDKFFRLSDNVSGTGLGLAISRGLVELHGGSLWVEERPGGGSTFVIQIPLEEAV